MNYCAYHLSGSVHTVYPFSLTNILLQPLISLDQPTWLTSMAFDLIPIVLLLCLVRPHPDPLPIFARHLVHFITIPFSVLIYPLNPTDYFDLCLRKSFHRISVHERTLGNLLKFFCTNVVLHACIRQLNFHQWSLGIPRLQLSELCSSKMWAFQKTT